MRPESEYQDALRLIETGMSGTKIGRRLGIPWETVRN